MNSDGAEVATLRADNAQPGHSFGCCALLETILPIEPPHLEQKSESQSAIMQQPEVSTSDLKKGTQIEIQWQPNRRCVLEYLGENSFVVIESEHSKLQKGNTFECLSFYLHHPLYIDNLVQGDNAPVSFVVGKRDGLTVVKRYI